MEFEEARVPTPGQYYRPETSADTQFNQRSVPAAFVPVAAYAIMTAFTPYEIGVSLWSFIAILAIPAASGLILHSIGSAISVHRRATRAFVLNFVLFVIYGLVNMSMIHDRIQESTSGFGALPTMLLSAAGYGLIAGVVAGFIASLPVHHHAEQGY
jgi:hypothetical protein